MLKSRLIRVLLFVAAPALLLSSCGGVNENTQQLTGVQGRRPWFHPQPYGTVYIPTGSFHMGQADQDIISSLTARPKQVTVQAFYMDDTEISNNEYRQFVYYVRDSIARQILQWYVNEGEDNERLDWRKKLDYSDPDVQDEVYEMYYQGDDKISNEKQFDTRKFIYKWSWLDLQKAAAAKDKDKPVAQQAPRKDYVVQEETPVYPDTLCWIRDFTYSFNEPMAQAYFWHPAYDNYPVVGVTWNQARAFCHWRTDRLNNFYKGIGEPIVNPFRLPTEGEWEYAARGGREFNPYPWGGPYVRNSRGCFLANFKPLRGNYMQDGGFYPVKVTSYFPNDYGLYCMAGNVAEWTRSAYDPSSYMDVDDMNPDFNYRAKQNDPETMKRKVIRGGSWKDIAYFIQTGTRTYEYQDTSKSYIGFRCVMTYMGRSNKDR